MHNNDIPVTPDGIPAQPDNNPVSPTPDANAVPPTTPECPPDTSAAPADNKTDPVTPDWFMADKFKTVDDQAKSYKELSTKMGKFWGSPQENYNIEGLTGVTESDPLIANLSPVLKEMGISQDGFKHLVNEYMQANSKMVEGMEAELKKVLTTTDVHTFQQVDKWMTETLTPEEQAHVKNNWLMSPADFKLFNSMRLMAAPSTNVPNAIGTGQQYESSKAVENDKITYRKEIKAGTRVSDKNHENALAARYRDAIARELRQKGR